VIVKDGTYDVTASGIITLETLSNMVFDIDGTHTVTAPTAAITYGNGTITVTGGDVVANNISLNSHVHSGVLSGPANTGGPV